MREVLVISGKGGAGKTSIAGAFAHLAHDPLLCDLDVDAPDLHLLLEPEPWRTEDFVSGNEAVIDPDVCTGCGQCAELCAFGAVRTQGDVFAIDPLRCEGCKVCVALCPAQAIRFPARTCGKWHESATRLGPMVHARLFPGQENSGRLVTLLKGRARELAAERGIELILSDGAPGIGCPVISSLAQVDLVVAVTEPTPSGRHDLERVLALCDQFRVPAMVLVNKADINPELGRRIEDAALALGCGLAGRIPFDPGVTQAMIERKTITEHGGPAAEAVTRAWRLVEDKLRALDAVS